jgi:hypothetical protein
LPPAPDAPLPRGPERAAAALTETEVALDGAIRKWLHVRGAPPGDVVLLALYQQRLYRLLARDDRLARSPAAFALLGYYREAQARFRVSWNVLAAVHFVESKFGKIRSASAAGAQGPMQFLRATWRAYGLGGNVHHAHDAIIGAANYLRASGAPHDLRRALYAYNHSTAYVDAVLRYARRIGADRTTFFALYNWQVFVKTPSGDRRVTGPGLP